MFQDRLCHFDVRSVQREEHLEVSWEEILERILVGSCILWCDRRRHRCTSATYFYQKRRFCQSACSFLAKITLKIWNKIEAQTWVHFWFWGWSCPPVLCCIKGWTRNSDILGTQLVLSLHLANVKQYLSSQNSSNIGQQINTLYLLLLCLFFLPYH